MSGPEVAAAPSGFDLDGVRRALEGKSGLRPIGLRRVHLGPDALAVLPEEVDALAIGRGPVVVLVDGTAMRRGSEDLKASVVARLSSTRPVRLAVIGAERSELHADERALAETDAAITGASVVVSVGSGTITDIAKDATYRARGPALVVVQTAVSVNAFSDDMAVLLRNGVKRTVPSRWPDVLIVDLPTIAGAPTAMNAAGFGELMAMFTAPADWYLATALGIDDSYDARVVRVFRDRGPALLDAAGGVAARTDDALAELAQLMTLSGIAMGAAGRTAPFSGMEHLVSHLLDMSAEHEGRPLALHGAQVGVSSIVAAIVWRQLLERLDPERLLAPSGHGSRAEMRASVEASFGALGTRAVAECWHDLEQKLERWDGAGPSIAAAVGAWSRHRTDLVALLQDPASIVDALRAAGAPTRFRELDPAPDERTVRWALASCHLMRNRVTVADAAVVGGLWEDRAIDEVLAAAHQLGAGL